MGRKNNPANQHRTLLIFTLAVILVYACSLSGYYLPPATFWPGTILSLGFVYLWLFLWILVIAWLRKKRGMAILLILLCIMGYSPISNSISIGKSEPFPVKKNPDYIRVMQWNCMGLRGNNIWWAPVKGGRKRAVEFIKAYQPDVICIQDYMDFKGKIFFSNEALLRDTLGYRYSVFALHNYNIEPYGIVKQGLLILSKTPIVKSSIYYYKDQYIPESVLWAEVMWQGSPIRFVTTHFNSIYLSGKKDFKANQPNYILHDKDIILSSNPVSKLRHYQGEHYRQAIQLKYTKPNDSIVPGQKVAGGR